MQLTMVTQEVHATPETSAVVPEPPLSSCQRHPGPSDEGSTSEKRRMGPLRVSGMETPEEGSTPGRRRRSTPSPYHKRRTSMPEPRHLMSDRRTGKLDDNVGTKDVHAPTPAQIKYDQMLRRLSSHETYKFDEEFSKVHHEQRVLGGRSCFVQVRQEATLLALAMTTGVCVSLVVLFMMGATTALHEAMHQPVQRFLECDGDHITSSCLFSSFLAFIGLRVLCVMIAAGLTNWQPHAKGSGMPQIKANLNGTEVRALPTSLEACNPLADHAPSSSVSRVPGAGLLGSEDTCRHHSRRRSHRRRRPSPRLHCPNDTHRSDGACTYRILSYV